MEFSHPVEIVVDGFSYFFVYCFKSDVILTVGDVIVSVDVDAEIEETIFERIRVR